MAYFTKTQKQKHPPQIRKTKPNTEDWLSFPQSSPFALNLENITADCPQTLLSLDSSHVSVLSCGTGFVSHSLWIPGHAHHLEQGKNHDSLNIWLYRHLLGVCTFHVHFCTFMYISTNQWGVHEPSIMAHHGYHKLHVFFFKLEYHCFIVLY